MFTHLPRPYITDSELELVLPGTANSRHSKIKRLAANGQLVSIRRGLYTIPTMGQVHSFELAAHIYSPSYISLESALAYHGLIPETVHSITSASAKRSKEFHTPLGIFSYLHLPADHFYDEVLWEQVDKARFFMAKPWKAICDYVYCYKKDWRSLHPLVHSLRIDMADLPLPSAHEIEVLLNYYQHRRITRFLTGIEQEIA